MHTLDRMYRRVARPWTAEELAGRHQAACRRGSSDLPAREPPPGRPIKGVRAAYPWLISLAVAAVTFLVVPGAWYVAAGALSGVVSAVLFSEPPK